jgi:hypothetical protein
MKTYHKRGSKSVSFILTARNWETKLKSLLNFSHLTTSIDTQLKKKPKDVLIITKFGKSRGKQFYKYANGQRSDEKTNYYYGANFTYSEITGDMHIPSKKQLLTAVKNHLEETWENIVADSDLPDDYEPHPLREIVFRFIY